MESGTPSPWESVWHPLAGSQHTPRWSTDTPARSASHSLPYVRPSQPHTGSHCAVHASGVAWQVPSKSQQHWPVASLQNSPAPHGVPAIPPQTLPLGCLCATTCITVSKQVLPFFEISMSIRSGNPPPPPTRPLSKVADGSSATVRSAFICCWIANSPPIV